MKPIITMSKLGHWGRFANQVFQYAFLRIYVAINNFDYQVPPWIGQYLFGHNDPSIDQFLPLVNDSLNNHLYDASKSTIAGNKNPRGNIDIIGYFQYHTSFYAQHQAYFRKLFNPTSKIVSVVGKTINILRTKGNTIIGCHLRRGDYGTFTRDSAKCFFVAPSIWYLRWLDENWEKLDKPVLFIASDELDKVKSDFKKYNPITTEDIKLPEASFYPDFYTLTQCNIHLISNSSFSFVASMLSTQGKEFFRPRLSQQKLISYDPWNSHTVLRDERY